MDSIWWEIFDILGTIAFAVSGVLVAVLRRLDLFGIFVLSAATAVGGGILRDVLVGHIPPVAFRTNLYIILILLTIVVTGLALRYIDFKAYSKASNYSKKIYLFCDAIGLASFTVTGTTVGMMAYPKYWILAVTLGVLTAVGGGAVRDILAGFVPGVLKKEIYATASLLGAFVLYGTCMFFDAPLVTGSVLSFALTLATRLLALRFHSNLPHLRRHRKGTRL